VFFTHLPIERSGVLPFVPMGKPTSSSLPTGRPCVTCPASRIRVETFRGVTADQVTGFTPAARIYER
jgi:hypothetical protein